MNTYMESQVMNMAAIVRTFERSCRMAAYKDDGTIDKTEEKQLKKIMAASEKFIRQLNRIH